MNNKIIFNISKIARNSLQLDLINAMLELSLESKQDIKRYEELIFVSLFNLEQIERYEKFMNLSLESEWSLEDRRNRIIYTLLSKSIFSVENLKEQALIFTTGKIEVIEDFANYLFIIRFTSIVGKAPNIENFRQFIELNKPAHLGYKIEFRYNTHGELNKYNLTHQQLAQYTHQQIYDTRIFEDE